MIKLLVFDFDGVMRPLNLEILYKAYLYIAEQMYAPKVWGDTQEDFDVWYDARYYRNLKRMDLTSKEDIVEANRLFFAYLRIDGISLPYKNVFRILRKLKKCYKLAILSNGPEGPLKEVIGENVALFECIVGKETLKDNVKPDPFGLFYLMDETGNIPVETVFIGDHHTDIQTGKNAGIKYCIGVPWGMDSDRKLIQAGADFILKDFKALEAIDEVFIYLSLGKN